MKYIQMFFKYVLLQSMLNNFKLYNLKLRVHAKLSIYIQYHY